MGPDALDEALRWLEQAEAEFEDARSLAGSGRYYLSLYLCQQSAEKALKAFIYMNEEEPVFSHSVATLLQMASTIDEDFKPLADAKRLDDYYIPTRYPNVLPGEVPARYYDDGEEAQSAIDRAGRVLELVSRKVRAGQ